MAIFQFLFQPKNELEQGGRSALPPQSDESEPERTCPNCHRSLPVSRIWANQNVCTCGHHFRMGARQRLDMLADGQLRPAVREIRSADPLDFPATARSSRRRVCPAARTRL
jgi:acetyl-CoA carboxylase carboxyl transferase subunit beta